MEHDAISPRHRPRRLTRSSRERMWAGVSGGLAEYFDIDPVPVRLLWVIAAILTGGLAIPVYIVLWIIMPRDDRVGAHHLSEGWREVSGHLQADARRLAEEARRVAETPSARAASWRAPEPAEGEAVTATVTVRPREEEPTFADRPAAAEEPVGAYEPLVPPPHVEPIAEPGPRPEGDRQRAAGVILIGLGLLFLAVQADLFRWVNWSLVWPLALVGLGVALLLRQGAWRW